MSLLLKIEEQSFDRINHVLTANDITGLFNVTTNPGGYGVPNPDRSSLAFVLSSTRVNGNEEVQWSDPLTDTAFDFTYISDGVYDVRLVAVEFEAGAFDPNIMTLGRVFYSVVDDRLYKVVQDGSGQTVENTNDAVANSLHVSLVFNFLVSSFSETKAIDIFCEAFNGGSCVGLREEYNDLNRVLDAIGCYFEEGYFERADNLFALAEKIKLIATIDDTNNT